MVRQVNFGFHEGCVLLLRLLEEEVRSLLFRAEDAAGEEDVNRVVIVDLLLGPQATYNARRQLSPD